jgi:homoserine dehydrogenase
MVENAQQCVQVGVIGAGTVGGGTIRVLAKNADIIASRALPVKLKWLAEKDQQRGREILDQEGLRETQLTADWHDIINDPDTDIVVELVGGTTLAYDIISAALAANKSVVTSNKDLMALRGGELLAIAGEHETDLFFEAAVAGGIPIIQAVKEGLAGNRISEIMGIVNGTTNYILSQMSETGADFAEALQQAQNLGYAEADPTSDVEGYDAARKMAILASIAFNSRVTYNMVSCEGITRISSWDILYAREFGYTIKMLGLARCNGEQIEVRVHPVMLSSKHPLSTVRDSYNAVFVTGDAVENAMFLGRGAGSLPTASAVTGDIIAAARNIQHCCKARWGCTCHLNLPITAIDDTVSKYYVRVQVNDEVGVFAALAQSLSAANVSMDAVMQKRRLENGGAEIVMITHPARHKDLITALSIIDRLVFVRAASGYIRVEDSEG